MALPALPVQGQNPWYDDRTNWDNSVEAALEGRLSESALSGEFSRVIEAPVDPHRYGAVGDGVTDDTAALQSAVDAIRDAGEGTLRLRPGYTYVVDRLNVQAGLTIEGTGATIFRPANTPNWHRTITNELRSPAASSVDSKPIILRGLTIDGNLAEQGPYTQYQLQQSMLINIQGNKLGAGRQTFIAEGLRLRNSVSDGIHIWHNVDATIRDLDAQDCFRGGVTITGGHTIVRLDNFRGHGDLHGAHIDMEVDSAGFGGTKRADLTARDVRIETAYPTGRSLNLDAFDGAFIDIDGLVAQSGMYVTAPSGRVSIRNGEIHTYSAASAGYRNVFPCADAVFENIRFVGHTAGGGTTRRIVQVTHHLDSMSGPKRRVEFRNCVFSVADPVGGDEWDAIHMESVPAVDSGRTIISGGRFGPEIKNAAVLARGGTLIIDGRPYVESERLARWVGVGSEGRPVNVTIGQVELATTCTQPWYLGNPDAANVIRHLDTLIDEAQNSIGLGTTIGATQFAGARIIAVTNPPTGPGFRGDRARLKAPSPGAVVEWVCTASSATSATWKALSTAAV